MGLFSWLFSNDDDDDDEQAAVERVELTPAEQRERDRQAALLIQRADARFIPLDQSKLAPSSETVAAAMAIYGEAWREHVSGATYDGWLDQ